MTNCRLERSKARLCHELIRLLSKWLDGVLSLLIGFVFIAPLLRSQAILGADAMFLVLLLLCLAGETELICRVRSMAGPCHSGDHYFLSRPTTGSLRAIEPPRMRSLTGSCLSCFAKLYALPSIHPRSGPSGPREHALLPRAMNEFEKYGARVQKLHTTYVNGDL